MRAKQIACALALCALAGSALAQQSVKPQRTAGAESGAPVTWSRDIAPLVYARCTTCHHPGGAGPFSLLTYKDARRWAPQIAQVTRSRLMPPWLPEPGYGDFADARRLSDHEVDQFERWLKNGMPEGDAAAAPAAPVYDATWQLGKPDLILKVPRAFLLQAGGTDVFRNFILPYPLKQTHYIRAMEIRPGAPQIVHHANVIIDRTAGFRSQHPDEWQDGVPGMELLVDSGNQFEPDSHFLFWKPDTPALIEQEGMPWRLDPGNDLILNMHLKPSGKAETIDAEVALYFTDKPPTAQPMLLQLDRDDALRIPAGDAHFVVEDSLSLPVAVKVLGVYPHAHYIGRDLQGWAILPNGEKKWLVWIRNWDIDRQSVYRFRQPLQLPQGSVLHMRYTYDNSSANAHNPNAPPIEVHAGNRSVDEMSHLWVQVLPEPAKAGAPDPRLLLEEAWMRSRLRKSPNDRVGLYNLAAAETALGKYSDAERTYERELELYPRDAHTLTALGATYARAGDWKKAEEEDRSAIAEATEVDQRCDARFNLAELELQHQELQAAEDDFRAHIRHCPEDGEAHAGLAVTLEAEEKATDAKAEFEKSLAIAPDDANVLVSFGQLESAQGDLEGATAHLRRALEIDPASADAHEQLARVDAQNSDLRGALDELRAAERLKPADPLIHSALSQILAATDDLESAVHEQAEALRLQDKDPDGWNNLGVMEARRGHRAQALAAFQHALQLKPDHAEARANLARLNGKAR